MTSALHKKHEEDIRDLVMAVELGTLDKLSTLLDTAYKINRTDVLDVWLPQYKVAYKKEHHTVQKIKEDAALLNSEFDLE